VHGREFADHHGGGKLGKQFLKALVVDRGGIEEEVL
jgi:hypothetical protein